ncbi:MAG: M20/M25/M40 family metallo-hydrolase [Myxococcota bacterium]
MLNRILLVCAGFALTFAFPLASSRAHAEQSRIVESVSKAAQFRTISHESKADNDFAEFDRFIRFLESRYPRTFRSLRVESISEYTRLLRWPGSDASLAPVMFDAHYDVVPVEPGTEEDWDYPAFSGAIAEGYVWGRGTIDDKSGLIATFEAIEELLEEGYAPERTLIFSAVHDEEAGGEEGAVLVAEKLLSEGIQLEYLIGEGGFMVSDTPILSGDRLMAMVATGEKGFTTLILRARGEGGHSSRPPKNNAIIRLSRAVTLLHENPFPPELKPPVSDMFEALAEHTPGFGGFLMRNQWMSRGLLAKGLAKDENMFGMVRTTTAVTMLNSGVKENVVPQVAEAAVNFRRLPSMTPTKLVEAVREIIDDPEIEIEFSETVAPGEVLPVADKNGPGFKMIEAAVSAEAPDAVVVPALLIATSDTRHYGKLTPNIYRFHTVTVSGDDAAGAHGTNERASVEGIERSVRLSRQLIQGAGSRDSGER